MRTNERLAALILLAALRLPVAAAPAAALPAEGTASWYGVPFHGRKPASGEVFDRFAYTAAHRTLPFGTVLLVTNLDTGARVVVRVNDRGPFVEGRMIDLSEAAAGEIGIIGSGTGRVRIEPSGGLPAGPLGGPALRAGEAGSAARARPESAGPALADEHALADERSLADDRRPKRLCDIQVASFSRPDNLKRALERLEAAGFRPEEERAGAFTRVVIRGLPAEEAEAARTRLAGMGFPGVLLSFYERAPASGI